MKHFLYVFLFIIPVAFIYSEDNFSKDIKKYGRNLSSIIETLSDDISHADSSKDLTNAFKNFNKKASKLKKDSDKLTSKYGKKMKTAFQEALSDKEIREILKKIGQATADFTKGIISKSKLLKEDQLEKQYKKTLEKLEEISI